MTWTDLLEEIRQRENRELTIWEVARRLNLSLGEAAYLILAAVERGTIREQQGNYCMVRDVRFYVR